MPMMQDDPESLLKLLELHFAWYPLMEPRDVYKLLYQGVLGSEHIISSPENFKAYLLSELDELSADPAERLLEPVIADQTLLRLNLRPLKARHIELNQLITALLETGKIATGTQVMLQTTWVRFVALCETGQIDQFSINTVHGFSAWLVEMAFPAVHHSDIYGRAYHPAYRLISTRFIPMLGMTDAG